MLRTSTGNCPSLHRKESAHRIQDTVWSIEHFADLRLRKSAVGVIGTFPGTIVRMENVCQQFCPIYHAQTWAAKIGGIDGIHLATLNSRQLGALWVSYELLRLRN
jgi:hypothetical protein